jgi:hypothetical protein
LEVGGALFAIVPVVCGSRPVAPVPIPTKSWIDAVVGSAPASAVFVFVSASLKVDTSTEDVLPRFTAANVASAAGIAGATALVPVENATRKYFPAPTVPLIVFAVQTVPVDVVCWTAQFVIVTGDPVGL